MSFQLVSVHDRGEGGALAVDLRQVLDAIGDEARRCTWVVTVLEGEGRTVHEAARRALAAPVPGDAMLTLADDVSEMLQSVVAIGWPPGTTARALPRSQLVASRAALLVECEGGAFYVVGAKDAKIIDKVKAAFEDVRDESPESLW